MSNNIQGWRKLFLFSLGLFAGTAFCMKWMEKDFLFQGQLFTIIGLEISYSGDRLVEILSGITPAVKQTLGYHLYFDFAFMAGVYPGIASLCMIARGKSRKGWLRQLLLILAIAQGIAWACDIIENIYLLNWIRNPASAGPFTTYHMVVLLKWILALTAALLAIPIAIRKSKY
ncbi:MAG: hypothetical protein IPP99_20160 [Chitinophagaceae bacterium]|jgi:hypothetical protein|nr:hypothetical protein [Chitinophagaceae bacterium]MBP6589728.1 hypothetical protein [Chitinophagaceae bacterium]